MRMPRGITDFRRILLIASKGNDGLESAMKRYSGTFDLSDGTVSYFSSYMDGVDYFRANGWKHNTRTFKGTDGKWHRHDYFERGMITATARPKQKNCGSFAAEGAGNVD